MEGFKYNDELIVQKNLSAEMKSRDPPLQYSNTEYLPAGLTPISPYNVHLRYFQGSASRGITSADLFGYADAGYANARGMKSTTGRPFTQAGGRSPGPAKNSQ